MASYPEYLYEKLLKSGHLFQITIDNVGDVFWRFFFILTPILYVPFFPGSVEAHTGWGENLNGHSMASCVRVY